MSRLIRLVNGNFISSSIVTGIRVFPAFNRDSPDVSSRDLVVINADSYDEEIEFDSSEEARIYCEKLGNEIIAEQELD